MVRPYLAVNFACARHGCPSRRPTTLTPGPGELRRQGGEVLGLVGAAGGVVLGVEVERRRVLPLKSASRIGPSALSSSKSGAGPPSVGPLISRSPQTGLTSTIFFLPAASLTTPSTRSAAVTSAVGVGLGLVVDPQAAALGQAPGLAARCRPGRRPAASAASTIPASSSAAAAPHGWAGRRTARRCSKAASRRLAAALAAASAPCSRRGGLVGQHLLGLVDLGARQGLQPGDLVQRQVGEQLQEPAHVGVLGVPPELPVVVGAAHVGVQPDRALGGLAHLGAGGGGEQRAWSGRRPASGPPGGSVRRR